MALTGGRWLDGPPTQHERCHRHVGAAPPEGTSVPLARFSRLYDALNHLVIEADFESRHVGERVLAGEHLAATGAR